MGKTDSNAGPSTRTEVLARDDSPKRANCEHRRYRQIPLHALEFSILHNPIMASTGSAKYDVIVIGGGHNGLVNAAYLARAGKRVLVLERRHVLGGAAVTEEIIPGFKFSVCSYVVSLLRPEIIRELDLPRHGLEILPLDGTFTPMPNGDHLWRVNDHAMTRREISRHSKFDAEAYEEFGKCMHQLCKFVKPILSMVPPDPTTLNPKDLMKLLFLGRRFQNLDAEDKYTLVQL